MILERTNRLRFLNGKLQQWHYDPLAERLSGEGPYERPPNGQWVDVEEITNDVITVDLKNKL